MHPERDIPERDLPERDLPERDLPERDLPERDLLERIDALEEELHRLRREAEPVLGPPYLLPDPGPVHVLLVLAGGREWGLLEVEEVVRLPRLTALPGAPDEVLGVLDLRGRKLPVISAPRRLGLPDPSLDLDTPVVIVRHAGAPYGVLVEGALRLVALPREAITPPPPDVPCAAFYIGLAEREPGRSVPILDPRALLSFGVRRSFDRSAAAPAPGGGP